jgi:DNA-binding LytR/AlgR family response regulator
MKKITCIIVEDEPASQDILQAYIRDYPSLSLEAVCGNAIEANGVLLTRKVQLMFLDITMPKLSGLDFYRSLTDPPKVIFTTAYPQYAVDGFEVNAVDYLVKPFPFERFLKAMNKLRELTAPALPLEGCILLYADKKVHKVSFTDIFYAEAMGDYARVHTREKTIVVHTTLQKLLDQLPASAFFRIHKSYIISLQHFDYMEGNMAIVNSTTLPIGQTYRNDFLTLLQQRSD